MIDVAKYLSEYGEQLALRFDSGDELNIIYGGNLDLYFSPISKEDKKELDFEIDQVLDYDLYTIFDSMYDKIINFNPLNIDLEDYYEEDSMTQPSLVQDDSIIWVNDDNYNPDLASKFIITRKDGKINIKFTKADKQDKFNLFQLCTNGNSKYGYYYIPFIEMYADICKTDFDYHQYSIEEYMILQKRMKK